MVAAPGRDFMGHILFLEGVKAYERLYPRY